jgi:hypothetical protein
MQARMRQHLGEVDKTVSDVTGMLSGLDDDQRTKLQQHLRAQPDLGMTIGEAIDDQAGLAGVSRKRRLQLRSMMTQTSFRLKHSAPGAVIDEYVEKVQRMTAQNGAQASLALRLAGRASQDLFWKGQGVDDPIDGSGGDISAPPPPPPTAPSAPPVTPPATPQKPKPHAGMSQVKTGATLMGVAVLTAGVSAIFIAAGGGAVIVGAIGLTVGAILFAVGFIVLIVGALIYAATPAPDPAPPTDPQAGLTWR